MKSPFPIITRIEPLLEAIKDKPGYRHVVKADEGYQYIDYSYMSSEMFQTPLERECRGIKFYLDGTIAARPFHKFFNMGERVDDFDVLHPEVLKLEKLDGSMVHGFMSRLTGDVQLHTRAGRTDIARAAEKLLTDDLEWCIRSMDFEGYTVIFEFVSPDNQIVLQYPEPTLFLTAIRHNFTGWYTDHSYLEYVGKKFNVPVVPENPYGFENLKTKEGIEGQVLVCSDGQHRIKLKTEWYVRLHKAKDFLSRDYDVLEAILLNQLDDLLPFCSEEDRKKVEAYNEWVVLCVQNRFTAVANDFYHFQNVFPQATRKQFASWVIEYHKKQDHALYFQLWDGKFSLVAVVEHVLKAARRNFEEAVFTYFQGARYSTFEGLRKERYTATIEV